MPNDRSSKASSVTDILDGCDVLCLPTRARLIAVLKAKAKVLPIRRRYIHPDDPRNMILPLRTRRDYTSVGRPTFFLTDFPDE